MSNQQNTKQPIAQPTLTKKNSKRITGEFFGVTKNAENSKKVAPVEEKPVGPIRAKIEPVEFVQARTRSPWEAGDKDDVPANKGSGVVGKEQEKVVAIDPKAVSVKDREPSPKIRGKKENSLFGVNGGHHAVGNGLIENGKHAEKKEQKPISKPKPTRPGNDKDAVKSVVGDVKVESTPVAVVVAPIGVEKSVNSQNKRDSFKVQQEKVISKSIKKDSPKQSPKTGTLVDKGIFSDPAILEVKGEVKKESEKNGEKSGNHGQAKEGDSQQIGKTQQTREKRQPKPEERKRESSELKDTPVGVGSEVKTEVKVDRVPTPVDGANTATKPAEKKDQTIERKSSPKVPNKNVDPSKKQQERKSVDKKPLEKKIELDKSPSEHPGKKSPPEKKPIEKKPVVKKEPTEKKTSPKINNKDPIGKDQKSSTESQFSLFGKVSDAKTGSTNSKSHNSPSVENLESLVVQLQKDLDLAKADNEKLVDERNKFDKEIKDLKKHLSDEISLHQENTRQLNDLKKKHHDLVAELSKAHEERDKSEAKLAHANNSLDEIQKKHANHDVEYKKLLKEKFDAELRCENTVAASKSLSEELELVKASSNQKDQIEKYHDDLMKHKKEVEAKNAEISNLKRAQEASKNDFENQLAELTKQVNDLKLDIEQKDIHWNKVLSDKNEEIKENSMKSSKEAFAGLVKNDKSLFATTAYSYLMFNKK